MNQKTNFNFKGGYHQNIVTIKERTITQYVINLIIL